jgi:hypothetical protein
MHTLFGNAPVAQRPQAPTPGNIPENAAASMASLTNSATAANGTIPASSPTAASNPASSENQFADLWDTSNISPSGTGQPLFNVSHEKLLETARQQNFKQNVTPEQMAAINAGGQEAINAMQDMINAATQAGYAQSVMATTKLIEGALEKKNFAQNDSLDIRFRDMQVKNGLREVNPVFSNPTYAPLLDAARNQFQVKYPNASATELQSMAINYIESMANAVNQPKAQASSKKQEANLTDWSRFLNS